jgi:uroporphyrin-III C-methyltransferase
MPVVGFSFLFALILIALLSVMRLMARKPGKVYLIGAGPGDPLLLTLKAAKAIATSDVIVYDYLVNPEILAHARRGAELIYVGKRAGQPSISQSEINGILIERATRGEMVARVKGGDPFVFGRGGEEAESLAEASIEWEVIPGVSSGVAAAAYAGIPLTHRGYASSVAFITGHESEKAGRGLDWPALARSADTLVVFMCAETITGIAYRLVRAGRAPSTPVAIIRWGTYQSCQEVYSTTLAALASVDEQTGEAARIKIEGLKIEPPAIAIIGSVVSLKDKLHWFGRPAIDIEQGEPVGV